MDFPLHLSWHFCSWPFQRPCQNLSLRYPCEGRKKVLPKGGINPGVWRHIPTRLGTLDGSVGGLGDYYVPSVPLPVGGHTGRPGLGV